METRAVDTTVLVDVAIGHLGCTVMMHLLKYAQRCISHPMDASMKQFDDGLKFRVVVCLDAPTHEELWFPGILTDPDGMLYEIVEMSTDVAMTVICLVSQLVVLITNLREQQDGLLLAILTF